MKQLSLKAMVTTAILSAIALVLTLFSFNVPLSPSFMKLDPSDFPALLAAFAFGPIAGVVVSFLKNALNILLLGTSTGGIGELANFLIGSSYMIAAGLIYQFNRTKRGAMISMIAGTLCFAVMGCVMNYFIILPMYTKFMPMDTIIAAYAAFIPIIKTKLDVIIFHIFPFNLVKGIIISLLAGVLYKPMSRVINAAHEGAWGR